MADDDDQEFAEESLDDAFDDEMTDGEAEDDLDDVVDSDDLDDLDGSDDLGVERPGADSPDAMDDALGDVIDSEILQLAVERDQFKDIAQRLQADFENYRKRVSTQLAAETDRATGRLAEAMLPVLDAFEAAFVAHPDVIEPLFKLTLAELRKQGLEMIAVVGEPFDPNLAEAVAHEPGDGGETTVADVLRTGYTWNGRTLRPAMVRTKD